MAVANKRQDAASPWAFIAFETEVVDTLWEAFEPEPVQGTRFTPLGEPASGLERIFPSEAQAAADVSPSAPESEVPIETGICQAELSFTERLRVVEEAHHVALAQLERRYTVELAEKLASQIEAQGHHLADEIGGRLTRLLTPLLMDYARKASLKALIRDLQRILTSGEVNEVTLSGPPDLVAQILAELGDHGSRLRTEDTDCVDLTVRVGSEVLGTRLCAWTALLKDVVS